MLSAEASRSPLRSRATWIALALIVLVAALLRFVPLPHEALSGDEMFSRRMATEPLGLAWYHMRQDLVHPPLYYFLLRGCVDLFSSSPTGVRVLSLLSGLALLPLLVVLGARLPGARWCGLLAAAAVAVGKMDLFYSQEARSYAFYCVLTVLLALWVAPIGKRAEQPVYWAAGSALMTCLVYTHYVGGVIVALLLLGVVLSQLPLRVKLRALLCGVVALLLFVPWLLAEMGVYASKKGLGENLNWQGHPGLDDLRLVFATAIGVGEFRGATTLAFLVLLILCIAALFPQLRQHRLRQSPVLLSVACVGLFTPLLIFVLSVPPINLPLFGLRHVLPAVVLLTLLSAYGLEQLAHRVSPSRQTALLVVGAVCLLLLAGLPTATALRAGPLRYPYDRLEVLVEQDQRRGLPAYAPWFYGIGEPVNAYCPRQCVQPLPPSPAALPPRLVFLYRASSKDENQALRQLLQAGYVEQQHTYATAGPHSPYDPIAATLVRSGNPSQR